ncbi:MAG: hypothetical protein IPG89_05315 [Bacteroidetes bacterium]|nr:hypothetical protein [Bacteroidota bacterium]
MLPFTESELLVIKQNKIKTITELSKNDYGIDETISTFNDSGRLIKQDWYSYKKKRGRISNYKI